MKGKKPATTTAQSKSSGGGGGGGMFTVGFVISVSLFLSNVYLFWAQLTVSQNVMSASSESHNFKHDMDCRAGLQADLEGYKLAIDTLEAQDLETKRQLAVANSQVISLQQQASGGKSTRQAVNTLRYNIDDLACGVITTAKYHKTRAKAVYDTWGPRCGVLLFFSATPDDTLPLIVLPGSEEGSIINEKVFGMFKYMWEHFPEKKWFIKADDDTYLHFENIIDMLSAYDYHQPVYVGRAGEWGAGDALTRYCGGGAGYIISQRAMELWYPHINSCQRLRVGEDVSVGKCLKDKIGLTPTFKTGFYHKLPKFFLTTQQGRQDHPEGLTIRPLSFHSIQPEEMYEVDYFCYTINTPLPERGKWLDPWPPSSPTH